MVALPAVTVPPVGRLCACAVDAAARPNMAIPARRASAVERKRALRRRERPSAAAASQAMGWKLVIEASFLSEAA
jgi:hypothetical protein